MRPLWSLKKNTGWRIMTRTALFNQSLCAKTWQLHGQSCLLGKTLVVVDEDLFFSHSALLRIFSLNWNDGQKIALVKTNSTSLQNLECFSAKCKVYIVSFSTIIA